MIVLVHEDQAAPATRITSILEEQALTVTVCPLATPQAAFEAALADASILIVLLTPAVRDNQTLSRWLTQAARQHCAIMPVLFLPRRTGDAKGPESKAALDDRRAQALRAAMVPDLINAQAIFIDGDDYTEVKTKLLRDAHALIYPADTTWEPPAAVPPRLAPYNPLNWIKVAGWLITNSYARVIVTREYEEESVQWTAAWFSSTLLWLPLTLLILLLTPLPPALAVPAGGIGWVCQGLLHGPRRFPRRWLAALTPPLVLIAVLGLWTGSPFVMGGGVIVFALAVALVAGVNDVPGCHVAYYGGQRAIMTVMLASVVLFSWLEVPLAQAVDQANTMIVAHVALIFFICLGLYFVVRAVATVLVKLVTLPFRPDSDADGFNTDVLLDDDELEDHVPTPFFFYRMLVVMVLTLVAYGVFGHVSFQNMRRDIDEAQLEELLAQTEVTRAELDDTVNFFNLTVKYDLPDAWLALGLGGAIGLAGYWLAGLLTQRILEDTWVADGF